jgi:hypothetical protein
MQGLEATVEELWGVGDRGEFEEVFGESSLA